MSRSDARLEPRISLITLGVSDLAASERFYTAIGFRKSQSASAESVVFMPLHGIVLGLFSRSALAEDAGVDEGTPGAFGGVTLSYNTRSRAEVDVLFATIQQAGGRPLKTPREVFWGGYAGYVADPDGHIWEIAFNPHWDVSPDGALRLPVP